MVISGISAGFINWSIVHLINTQAGGSVGGKIHHECLIQKVSDHSTLMDMCMEFLLAILHTTIQPLIHSKLN